LGITTLTTIGLLSVAMLVYLSRHMPSRDFALFCLVTAAYLAIGLALLKIFAEKIKQDRRFRIFLELILAAVFVGLCYWFGAYVSPGMK